MGKKPIVSKYHAAPIRDFVKRIGCGHLIPKLNKSRGFWEDILESYHQIHYRLEDYSIGLDVRNELRDMISIELSIRTIEIDCLDEKISLWDFWVNNSALNRAVQLNFSEESKLSIEICSILDEVDGYIVDAFKTFDRFFAKRLMQLSAPESFIYSYTWKVEMSGNNPLFEITLKRKKSDRRDITIRGKTRKVYRPEIYYKDGITLVTNVYIDEKDYREKNHGNEALVKKALGQDPEDGMKFSLFFQAHALRRLEERLDTLPKRGLPNRIILISEDPRLILYKGTYLLRYNIYNTALGYFICEFIDDIVVAKTFLFISQDGTPEGDALSKKLSIERGGKQHLNLTKLSHFSCSDIREDATMLSILKECKLDHLCVNFKKPRKALTESALYIRDTLQLGSVGS